jgi:hypothetical protein
MIEKGSYVRADAGSSRLGFWGDLVMMNEGKKPNEPGADPQQEDDGGTSEPETFANIEPDSGESFANIEPDKE